MSFSIAKKTKMTPEEILNNINAVKDGDTVCFSLRNKAKYTGKINIANKKVKYLCHSNPKLHGMPASKSLPYKFITVLDKDTVSLFGYFQRSEFIN